MVGFGPLGRSPLGRTAGPSKVTGSGSPQAATATASGSGAVIVLGGGTPQAVAATTSNATGSVKVSGSGAPQADTATATSGSGAVVVSGSGSPQSQTATATGTGSSSNTGEGSPQAETATASGSGTVDVSGSGSPQAETATTTGSGAVRITGSGSGQAQTATVNATADLKYIGSGSPQAETATGSGSGRVKVSGSGSPQAQPSTSSGSGAVTVVGSGAPAAQTATASGSGGPKFVGSGSPQAEPATSSGTGSVKITGSGSPQSRIATANAAVVQTGTIPEDNRTYLVEFEHNNGTSVLTERLTDGYGYTTQPTDTPAQADYEPRLNDPGNFEVTALDRGRTQGQVSVGIGSVSINNLEGRYDSILSDGFAGYELKIRRIANEQTPLSKAKTLFTGTMKTVSAGISELSIELRDKNELLREDIQDNTYAGTTTDGTKKDAEGDKQVKDDIKPLAYGNVKNAKAKTADRFNLVYQFAQNGVSDVSKVYDRALELIDSGTNHGTLSDLYSASIQAARYDSFDDEGMVRLGASPDGTVTADLLEGGTSSDRTAAQVAKRMILDNTSLTSSDLVTSSFDNLDNKNSAEVGYYIDSQVSVLRAVSDVLQSIGAYIAPTAQGKFAVYRLELPNASASPVATFDEDTIYRRDGLNRIPTGDQGNGIPAWKVTLNFNRNWTVQEDDQVAGRAQTCVSQERKEFLRNQWRQAIAKDTSVLNKHPRAPALEFNSYLIDRSAAESEASRLLNIYKEVRERYRFTVKASKGEDVRLNDTIQLKFDRFGLSGGKLFKVIGINYRYQDDTFTFDVWGGITPT